MAEDRRGRRLAAVLALTLAAPLTIGTTGLSNNLDSRLLAAHNRERTDAGIRPLRWDAGLAADAAVWARELAASGAFEHSPDDPDAEEPQGENLWAGTPGRFTPEDMVGMWIAEKAVYRPGPLPNVSRTGRFEDVGHYTQVMWRETGEVGCALAKGAEEEVLVCRYSQAGNVDGEVAF